jgi:hypothetical protein
MTINVKIENQDQDEASRSNGKQRIVKVSYSDYDSAPVETDRLLPGGVTTQVLCRGRRLVLEEVEIDASAPETKAD